MAGGRGAGQGRPRHPGTATTRHPGTTSATLIKWSGQRAGAGASLLSDDEYTIFGEGAYYLLLLDVQGQVWMQDEAGGTQHQNIFVHAGPHLCSLPGCCGCVAWREWLLHWSGHCQPEHLTVIHSFWLAMFRWDERTKSPDCIPAFAPLHSTLGSLSVVAEVLTEDYHFRVQSSHSVSNNVTKFPLTDPASAQSSTSINLQNIQAAVPGSFLKNSSD